MMKFKAVVLCLKLLTCLIVQRSFGKTRVCLNICVENRKCFLQLAINSRNVYKMLLITCRKTCFKIAKTTK